MTYEQNVKSILECYFTNCKDELIESACKRICEIKLTKTCYKICDRWQRTERCKNCKYFEYDSVAKVDGIPLIVAHEICKRWGDGCKTSEDGFCFLYEQKESEV